jgi:hypothetical protein
MIWIVTDNATGHAVLETFSAKVADLVNQHSTTHTVQEAGEYLGQLNARYREELTPAGPQLLIPGCETRDRPRTAQLSLWP